MSQLKILVVDDNRIFRESVKSVIEQENDMLVAGEAGDGTEALEMIQYL